MKSALKVHFCLALALLFVMSSLASAHIDVSAVLANALIQGNDPPLILDVREPSEYCGLNAEFSNTRHTPSEALRVA